MCAQGGGERGVFGGGSLKREVWKLEVRPTQEEGESENYNWCAKHQGGQKIDEVVDLYQIEMLLGMVVLKELGEKPSKQRREPKTNSTYRVNPRIPTWATLVAGEYPHHCTNRAYLQEKRLLLVILQMIFSPFLY